MIINPIVERVVHVVAATATANDIPGPVLTTTIHATTAKTLNMAAAINNKSLEIWLEGKPCRFPVGGLVAFFHLSS